MESHSSENGTQIRAWARAEGFGIQPETVTLEVLTIDSPVKGVRATGRSTSFQEKDRACLAPSVESETCSGIHGAWRKDGEPRGAVPSGEQQNDTDSHGLSHAESHHPGFMCGSPDPPVH